MIVSNNIILWRAAGISITKGEAVNQLTHLPYQPVTQYGPLFLARHPHGNNLQPMSRYSTPL